jgi:alpha-D-ribose 1-methylphosphonate 5-triphosphate synthase subunit PhnH
VAIRFIGGDTRKPEKSGMCVWEVRSFRNGPQSEGSGTSFRRDRKVGTRLQNLQAKIKTDNLGLANKFLLPAKNSAFF